MLLHVDLTAGLCPMLFAPPFRAAFALPQCMRTISYALLSLKRPGTMLQDVVAVCGEIPARLLRFFELPNRRLHGFRFGGEAGNRNPA